MEKRTLSEKELLLYQAVIELLDEGMEVHQIKVSDITNRAGVGKGTAYEYFSSKEEMIAKAIYWHGNQRFLELVENLKRQKSLKDQLMEVFNFIENVVYKDNGCRQLFKLPQSEEKAQKEIEEKMKSAREYAQTVLELIAKQGREENSIHPEFSDFQIQAVAFPALFGYFVYLAQFEHVSEKSKESLLSGLCFHGDFLFEADGAEGVLCDLSGCRTGGWDCAKG